MNTTAGHFRGWIFASVLGLTHFACSGTGNEDAEGSGGSGDLGAGGSGAGTGGDGAGTGGDGSGSGGDAPVGTGGAGTGGSDVGSGGSNATGGDGAIEGSGGSDDGSGGDSASGGFTGTCTASSPTGDSASGSGPHDVIIETNGDPGINEGTIYRPADLGGSEKYPIFVWGEGGCSQDGYSNRSAMAEIASHGYVVVADGTPGGSGGRDQGNAVEMAEPLLAYVQWLIEENEKPCSAFYQSMDTSKVGANGFSCGGLMATGTAGDPRITTWGHTSSGLFSADDNLYDSIHTPVLIVTGSEDSLGAHENGRRDFEDISASQDVPIMFFEKEGADHGGDLFSPDGGEFTEIILAWLNWWLKGDEGATGKGALVGASCSYCTDPSWEVLSTNVQ